MTNGFERYARLRGAPRTTGRDDDAGAEVGSRYDPRPDVGSQRDPRPEVGS
jgi:hypothetical protein